jgi:hypothetical protein
MNATPNETDTVCAALAIAMNYLKGTGQAEDYHSVQSLARTTILEAHRHGVCHRIALANNTIVAVEKMRAPIEKIEYPRVS